MLSTLQDFRFALRRWRNHPGFTAIALLSLALGIGANTSIFSLMDALMLRQLPVRQPEQLTLLSSGRMSGTLNSFPAEEAGVYSQPFLDRVRQQNQVFSDVAGVESMRADVHGRFVGDNSESEPLKIRLVSGSYFALLGVGPAAGRVLTLGDDEKPGANPVAVMSYAFWQRRFSRDATAVGKAVTFNGASFTVIGVAAREFSGTIVDESPDLWIPLSMQAKVQPWLTDPRGNLMQTLWLIGRLKPGVSQAAAQTNANVVYQQWLHEVAGASPSPLRVEDMRKARIQLYPAATGSSDLRRQFSDPLRILMVLVGLVLLIACVNIANLLLAQATGRQREIAVRLALGADRRRLMGQLLSESLLLAFVGGALGVLIAWWGGQLMLVLVQNGPDKVPLEVGPNSHVLLFTFGLSLATGLFFGLAPALRMTRVDVAPSLKEGKGTVRSQSRSRFGQALVAGQVALALFLMIGAGLFVRTLEKLEQTNTGFERSRTVLLQLDSDASNAKGPALVALRRRVEDRIRALPGVQAVSYSMLTFNEGQWFTVLWPDTVQHLESTAVRTDGNRVGPQYFGALGVPIVMGRSFGPQDTPQSPPVAMVNEALAQKLYPGQSAIGRRLIRGLEKPVSYEIVGVVKDAKYLSLREKTKPMFFVDTDQERIPDAYNDLVVRVQGPPEAFMSQIRAAIRGEDPNLAVWDMMTLGEAVERSLGREKLLAKLAGFFGALALLLASIGLYGVMAYSVSRRTNEIGIRMALGAQPGAVLGMVLRESVILVVVGFAVGIPAALACGRFVSSQLYGVAPNDVLTVATAAAILLAVALAASFLPARRAALLDPLTALREE
ncbi:MAG TPA: ABC transporter permease [Bryobacteraceae bacterium]|nr:ABC transporter permease [Bryobacteraceae bacterium]